MNKYFEKIAEYLEEENISYDYNVEENTLVFYVSNESSEQKIKLIITDNDKIFIVYLSIIIDFNCEDYVYKISEYIHRANLGMLRGNFEFDLDSNVVTFKHYFEKTIVSDKDYTLYNTLLPLKMCFKYIPGFAKIIETQKSPKEIIEQIESESN